MADDPKYVRLSPRLTRGMLCDVGGSGWSITGFDVKPFPADHRFAAKYVRENVNNGNLEAASKAEYDEVREADQAVAAHVAQYGDTPVQEGDLMKVAARHGEAMVDKANASRAAAARGEEEDDDSGEEDDDSDDDTEEEQGEVTPDKAKRPAKKAAKRSSK